MSGNYQHTNAGSRTQQSRAADAGVMFTTKINSCVT
jgi:hypothetical protein